MSDDLVVVEQALSTQPLRKIDVGSLRMLHHYRLVDGGNRMPRVTVSSGIHEVLDRMLRPRLNNIRLRDRSENGDLLVRKLMMGCAGMPTLRRREYLYAM